MGPIFGRNVLGKRPPSTSSGWRVIEDRKIYFRSRWEYNYACYLSFLKKQGVIVEWEFEKETFWFEKIKRGVRSYLPDFIVHVPFQMDPSRTRKEVHEVKGYMDSRSVTKLKRMKKYYPEVNIVLIDEKWFRANAPKLKYIVPGWENGNKKSY